MTFKKICVCILTVAIILSSMTMFVMAANNASETSIVYNGGFEKMLTRWGTSGVASFGVDSKNPYAGKNALKISTKENAFVSQNIYFVPGEEYTLKFYARSESGDINAVVKFEMWDAEGKFVTDDSVAWGVNTQWKECTYTLTAPEKVERCALMLRVIGGGTLYFDEVSVEGAIADKTRERDKEIAAEEELKGVREPMGEANLLTNGGLEILGDDGFPKDVSAKNGWGGPNVSLETEDVYEGNYAARIDSTGQMPFISYEVQNLYGGATYQLSLWYKGEIRGDSGFCVKVEEYMANKVTADTGVGSFDTPSLGTAEEWTQLVHTFTLPKNAICVRLYPRVYSNDGTMLVDDVKFYMVEGPEQFSLDTDGVFYYPDHKLGTATVLMQDFYEDDGYTADFKLTTPEGKTLIEGKGVPFDEDKKSKFIYSTSGMTKMKTAYYIKATVKDKTGKVVSELSQDIYKYPRPTLIGKDGVARINGKIVNPTLLYHGGPEDTWSECVANGINLFQTTVKETTPATLAMLDTFQSHGAMAAIVLYLGMRPAGHPDNQEAVKKIVASIKDHPAVFCWMIMDEPFAHDANAGENLKNSYKIIRDIDDVHPVIVCESSPNFYKVSGKYVDILSIDPYPGDGLDYGRLVADRSVLARECVNYEKPVYNILQVFTFGKSRPTQVQCHSMMYQALMGGSQNLAYYPFVADNPALDDNLNKSIYWPVIQQYEKEEAPIMLKYFGHLEGNKFGKYRNDDLWYDVWEDGGTMYAAVQNRTAETKKDNVSLTSLNGKITVSDYDIEVCGMGDISTVTKQSGSFDVELEGHQAILYKITPKTQVDFSKLNNFGDIDDYAWAEKAIMDMYNMGIVNSKGDEVSFAPGDKLTRGEMAMFMIRALNLDTSFTENFADVDVNAEYAREVAVGKKLGILKGVSATEFNPEAPITRQDLMVICIRAMEFLRAMERGTEQDLAKFSDNALIADYARTGVATMVKTGIIEGNEDGTINPLGNTTRAEAAVIMSRIVDWNK